MKAEAHSTGSSRAALLAALMKPRSYPHEVGEVERIDTHISTVLLTGPFAYKIKKPLDLGFLDFTSLASRRHFCEEELRLNRRLAPDLYLEVVAICGTPDSPRLQPIGEEGAFEYAVKMKQFAQQGLLDRMLVAGDLTPRHVDALAQTIANFHSGAERAVEGDRHGMPNDMEVRMRQNFVQIRALIAAEEDCSALNAIEDWSRSEHAAVSRLMAQRKRQGQVRECHGDLHLGNIALVDGEIRVFDCIEFDAGLRWTDVAAEIAFLVMDFAARGRPNLGARFLNAYLEITGDYEAARLLPYYLVYRALVRAKVARIRGHQAGLPADKSACREDFVAHLRLAQTYTEKRRPCLIITHGFSGSGKTTLTQALLEQMGALRLRSDLERKRLHHVAARAHSDSAIGAGLYAETATEATYDELQRLAQLLIDCGWPCIVDAAFLKRGQRDRFRTLVAGAKVPMLLLDCHADLDKLRRRVARRLAAGADASEATLAVLEHQLRTAEPLSADEYPETIFLNTEDDDRERWIREVSSRLSGMP